MENLNLKHPPITEVINEIDKEIQLALETQAILHEATVMHIAPPWVPVHPYDRKYGGIEDIIWHNIISLQAKGVKQQILYGTISPHILDLLPEVRCISSQYAMEASLDML